MHGMYSRQHLPNYWTHQCDCLSQWQLLFDDHTHRAFWELSIGDCFAQRGKRVLELSSG